LIIPFHCRKKAKLQAAVESARAQLSELRAKNKELEETARIQKRKGELDVLHAISEYDKELSARHADVQVEQEVAHDLATRTAVCCQQFNKLEFKPDALALRATVQLLMNTTTFPSHDNSMLAHLLMLLQAGTQQPRAPNMSQGSTVSIISGWGCTELITTQHAPGQACG
jgi:hypothetical protein